MRAVLFKFAIYCKLGEYLFGFFFDTALFFANLLSTFLGFKMLNSSSSLLRFEIASSLIEWRV